MKRYEGNIKEYSMFKLSLKLDKQRWKGRHYKKSNLMSKNMKMESYIRYMHEIKQAEQ